MTDYGVVADAGDIEQIASANFAGIKIDNCGFQ